jgi:fatty-acyl-CoA synthase
LTESYCPAEQGDAVRDATLGELLREAAAAVPDRLALVDGVEDPSARQEWTYAEFLQDAERTARALLKRFQPGDRGDLGPEQRALDHPSAGHQPGRMILVAANPAYCSRELEHILSNLVPPLFYVGSTAWPGAVMTSSAHGYLP